MPEASPAEWREFLNSHPQSHFLQTAEWGELKASHGWSVARLILGSSGAQILFRRLPLGVRLGYVAKIHPNQIVRGEAQEFWMAVAALCRTKGAIACKIEVDQWADPEPASMPEGCVPSRHSIQPRRTIVIDLRADEDTILARMKQKCRYNIRLAEKKGVTVRAWNDVPAFHAMLEATGRRDGFSVHSQNYYERAYDLFRPGSTCELLMAEGEGVPLCALMVFARGDRAWYVYGGSSELQREKMPNYLLQWEAMRWAKARGCAEYDLWGVPDSDESVLEAGFAQRNDGLWGVYRFKRGFGGEVRRAEQALDMVFRPLLYRLYILAASRRLTA